MHRAGQPRTPPGRRIAATGQAANRTRRLVGSGGERAGSVAGAQRRTRLGRRGARARGGYGEVPTTMDQVVVRATMPRVYSRQDAGVEPPAFIYPQMPSEPKEDSLPSDSHIEVTVDEQGRVVQVRLRSSDASLNDRMIVAAAKAWQFRPALKDGQPVPYVLQVPVIR